MASTGPARNQLVGFRVTKHEHDLLRLCAAAEERTVTGMLRKLLGETVEGFGATKQRPSMTAKEATR